MTVVDFTAEMKVLLDRVNAGFNVEVGTIPTTGEYVLRAWTDSYHAKVPILPEQALEAYLHPCAFIPNSDRFFRELKEGEPADEVSLPRPPAGVLTAPRDASDPMDYCEGCTRSLLAHETGPYCDNCSDDGS